MSVFHDLKKGAEKLGHEVENGVKKGLRDVESSGQQLEHDVKNLYHRGIRDAEQEFRVVESLVTRIVDRSLHAALHSEAIEKAKTYAGAASELRHAWPIIERTMSSELSLIRSAAHQHKASREARNAIKAVANRGEILRILRKLEQLEPIKGFGVEFELDVSAVVGAQAAVGMAVEIPKIEHVAGYGSVGLTVGGEAGGSAGVALSLTTSPPRKGGGADFGITVAGDADIGFAIGVSFDLPDPKFAGVSFSAAGGEEVELSMGGGYTFTYD